MEVVYRCCCGLDVHKDSVTACVLWVEASGSRRERRKLGTFTGELLALSDWLRESGVTGVGPLWGALLFTSCLRLTHALSWYRLPSRFLTRGTG